MSVEDSESRRFELTFGLSFSQADLGPRSVQELYFSGFFEKFETYFFEDLCSWRAVQTSFGEYL